MIARTGLCAGNGAAVCSAAVQDTIVPSIDQLFIIIGQ